MDFFNYLVEREHCRLFEKICLTGKIDTEEEWEAYLEMAAPATLIGGKEEEDIRKAPVLFDNNDIAFLYQFPPRHWKQALSYRYNTLIQETHKKVQLAKQNGTQYDPHDVSNDYGFVTLKIQGKYFTYFVSKMAGQIYDRLTADVHDPYFRKKTMEDVDPAEMEGLSGKEKREKYYEKGYGDYGYVLGDYVPGGQISKGKTASNVNVNPIQKIDSPAKIKAREKKQAGQEEGKRVDRANDPDYAWVFKGYTGMSQQMAGIRLSAWLKMISDGWLSGPINDPRRKMLDTAPRVNWSGKKEDDQFTINPSRPKKDESNLKAPVRDGTFIEAINKEDNSDRESILQTYDITYLDPKLSEEPSQEGRHWRLDLSSDRRQNQSQKYTMAIKGLDYGVAQDKNVAVRVWKYITSDGKVESISEPLPILQRGKLINNTMYRMYESTTAMRDRAARDLKDTTKSGKIADDLKNGHPENSIQRLQQEYDEKVLRGTLDPSDETRLTEEITYWMGLKKVVDHLNRYFFGWRQKNQQEILQLISEGPASYINTLTEQAKAIVLDTCSHVPGENDTLSKYSNTLENKKGLADEHDYNFYVNNRQHSMYHYIRAGGSDPNKGTKRYHQTSQEKTDRYEQEHEKYFGYSGISDDETPVVDKYPFLDDEQLNAELISQQNALTRLDNEVNLLENFVKQRRSPTTQGHPRLSLAEKWNKLRNQFKLHDMPDEDASGQAFHWGDRKLSEELKNRLVAKKGKKGENSFKTAQNWISHYSQTEEGAYDIMRRLFQIRGQRDKARTNVRFIQDQIGEEKVRLGPIGIGINSFLSKLPEGSPEYLALKSGLQLLYKNAQYYVKRNLGKAQYQDFIEVEDEYKDAQEKLDKAKADNDTRKITEYGKIASNLKKNLSKKVIVLRNKIMRMGYDYAKSMWQLDIAENGTRRQREARRKMGTRAATPDIQASEPLSKNLTQEDKQRLLQLMKNPNMNPDAFTGFILKGFEGRSEQEGVVTSRDISSIRNWLAGGKTIQSDVEDTQADVQKGNLDADVLDITKHFDIEDYALVQLVKKAHRAFNLMQLGYIVTFERDNGRKPTEAEIEEHMKSHSAKHGQAISQALTSQKQQIANQLSGRTDGVENIDQSNIVHQLLTNVKPVGADNQLKNLVVHCQEMLEIISKRTSENRLEKMIQLDMLLLGTARELQAMSAEERDEVEKKTNFIVQHYRTEVTRAMPMYEKIKTLLDGLTHPDAYDTNNKDRLGNYARAEEIVSNNKIRIGSDLFNSNGSEFQRRFKGPIRNAITAAVNKDPQLPNLATRWKTEKEKVIPIQPIVKPQVQQPIVKPQISQSQPVQKTMF
jgi:hypothetical protein